MTFCYYDLNPSFYWREVLLWKRSNVLNEHGNGTKLQSFFFLLCFFVCLKLQVRKISFNWRFSKIISLLISHCVHESTRLTRMSICFNLLSPYIQPRDITGFKYVCSLWLLNVCRVCLGVYWGWGRGWGGPKPYETLLTYFSRNLYLCEMSEARLNGGRTAAWIGCGWHC